MVISDLHYEKQVFRNVDESRAWDWLLSIVEYHEPSLLLSCGDWGSAVNPEEFNELLSKTIVLTIYGNHENLDVLSKLYNVKSSSYLPVLMEDARVYNIGGLRVAGISGIVAKKRKMKKGVPRKRAEEFIDVALRLKDKNVDVLLLHEAPSLEIYRKIISFDFRTETALEAIKIIKPKIVFNGHLHFSPYTIYKFNDISTLYVRIDSSQAHRHYALYYPSKELIEVWRDYEKVDEVKV